MTTKLEEVARAVQRRAPHVASHTCTDIARAAITTLMDMSPGMIEAAYHTDAGEGRVRDYIREQFKNALQSVLDESP